MPEYFIPFQNSPKLRSAVFWIIFLEMLWKNGKKLYKICRKESPKRPQVRKYQICSKLNELYNIYDTAENEHMKEILYECARITCILFIMGFFYFAFINKRMLYRMVF